MSSTLATRSSREPAPSSTPNGKRSPRWTRSSCPFSTFTTRSGWAPRSRPPTWQVIASDCFGLLRVASDCFGLLRVASGCFGLLRIASGPKVAPANVAGARSSLDSHAAAAISRAAAARSQAPPLPPDDLRMLDPRAGLQVDGIVSPSGAEALRAPAKAFLGPGGGTAHVRLLLCAEAAARLPATLPGEDGHAAGHVEGAPSKPMSAALGSTPDDNDANPLARILDEIRFT